jgi:hypothetical protein
VLNIGFLVDSAEGLAFAEGWCVLENLCDVARGIRAVLKSDWGPPLIVS